MSIHGTRLWWIRHGPTHQHSFCGWRDVPADLSDTGALARLSSLLPETAIVTSSDLIRATATAEAIAGNRRRLAPSAALREFNFGAWEGLSFAEVSARDPEICRSYWENPGEIAPPEGESWNAAASRVASHVETLIDTHPGADLVLVAHYGIIQTQVARATGLAPAKVIGQPIDNLSLTRIAITPEGWRIECINHLE
jgi:alpha-ribazole phosphatase